MLKKNDDSIGKFFRKAVSHHDNSFRESDWKAMEKKLDEHASMRAPRRLKTVKQVVLFFAAALILSGGGYLLGFYERNSISPEVRNDKQQEMQAAEGKESPQHKEKDVSSTASLLPSETNSPDNKITGKKKSEQPVQLSESTSSSDTRKAERIQSEEPQNSVREQKKPDGIVVPEKSTSIGAEKKPGERDLRSDDQPISAGTKTSGAPLAENLTAEPENTTAKQKLNTEEIAENQINDHRSPGATANKSFSPDASVGVVPQKDTVSQPSAPEEKITLPAEPVKEEQKRKETDLSRWSIFLSLAPDFSSTSLGRMTSPGEAYGFRVGYRIFPRISIHTGLIRSSKKYEARGSEYQPPKGYWAYRTNGVVPDEISGKCTILEIPLWVQVDIKQSDRSRFFVSGGASSYLMTSQSYHYKFKTPNPGAAEGWSSSDPSSYLLAAGHLSVGYERSITPRIAFGIEPFVKMPFTGIGWSHVSLFTTGFYMNVRYRFLERIIRM